MIDEINMSIFGLYDIFFLFKINKVEFYVLYLVFVSFFWV